MPALAETSSPALSRAALIAKYDGGARAMPAIPRRYSSPDVTPRSIRAGSATCL